MRVHPDRAALYAGSLDARAPDPEREPPPAGEEIERRAALWLTLDAINFGSGWFPTLVKAPGCSGYATIANALRRRFEGDGPWSSHELVQLDAAELAAQFGQPPGHPLMECFAQSLQDLGGHLCDEFDGRFSQLVDAAGGSAVALAERLGAWSCFADSSTLDGIRLPFFKRAQLAAADLARAGVLQAPDLEELTMFADNLVPHVLRLDGILSYEQRLQARIERFELIPHDSREEIEMRACAVHAVELIVAAAPGSCAARVDQVLWTRGQQPKYKAQPRHRCRCTAY